ncbi:MAG: CDP-glycerol glycerophosphotransferase family protein, partial [Patescibacteria group bacterium]
PAYFTHFAQYIRDECPLLADHILVWSERQKQFWIKSGVTPERITVTGQPRSDFWRQPERWPKKNKLSLPGLRPDAPMFLFFTYDPWAYTPDYMIAKGEMHWNVLRQETHRVLFNFARQHPEIDLVIKAHPQQSDIAAVAQEIASARLSNVFLATGASLSNDLIVNADCIIGFQTTALIETMVTNKPIIYTFWGEAKDRWASDLIPFHLSGGVNTVTNPKELLNALESILTHPTINHDQRSARDQFITEYFTTVDGRSAQRAFETIALLLKITK